jgi:hypothetical protein
MRKFFAVVLFARVFFGRVFPFLAAQTFLEVADRFAQPAADLRQLARTEQNQGDHQNDQKLLYAESKHKTLLDPFASTREISHLLLPAQAARFDGRATRRLIDSRDNEPRRSLSIPTLGNFALTITDFKRACKLLAKAQEYICK